MPFFFHVDLDAFFASVELLDDPGLKGKPVVVGAASSRRGVVSTCSYEARRFGIHSAMPIAEAKRRCPHAIFLPVRMERYAELSARVMAVFSSFTPDVLRVSIDEASIDMTGTERLWGPPIEAARALKRRVSEDTGLTISVGIAPNRYIAKIASGLNKPDGLTFVAPGEEENFMDSLPLEKLWGAGTKTRERLLELGIDTIAKLRSIPEGTLSRFFGKAGGVFLYRCSRGMDPGTYGMEAKSRSVSTETTFEWDVRDRDGIEAVLLGMSEELCARLYEEDLSARSVQLKLRYDDFETVSVRETREGPFLNSQELYEAGLRLFDRKWAGRPIRLIGLGLVNVGSGEAAQGNRFEAEGEAAARKTATVERAAFAAAKRGLGKITRARLVPRPGADKSSGPKKPL